jgi:hypothetical protein
VSHVHKWVLGEFVRGGLVPISDRVLMPQPGNSTWLCQCGAIKTVDLLESREQ